MSERLEESQTRICRDCGEPFITVWATRLCMTCKYDRASRSRCETCGQKTGQTGRFRCSLCRYGPDPLLRPLTDIDQAWLAGIVEGEGTFSRPNSRWGLVRVVMTDKDVIDRLATMTGIGNTHVQEPRKEHHRRAWDWTVLRRVNVHELCHTLAPLLLERRRKAVMAILEANGSALPPSTVPAVGSPAAWAWIAAVIEGEGWIGPAPEARRPRAIVGVQSTDRDVIDRLHHLTGVGHVIQLNRMRQPHFKPSWRWAVTNRAGVQDVLWEISPQLGQRRAERARHVLAWLRS
jgi:hypothetical protein